MSGGYSEQDIQVLEGLEPVRLRPGMYIGSTGPRGLHHLVYEIVDNAVDECLAGHCSRIDVDIDEDNVVTVTDDGRGIPVGIHPEAGIPTPELVMTRLHAGGKFGSGGYKVAGGLHGVGASVVNALSEFMELEIWKDGVVHRQRYERGEPVTPLERGGSTRRRGTRIRFRPDDTIFATVDFTAQTIAKRLRELAFLNPDLTIRLRDRRRREREDAEPGGEAAQEPPSEAVETAGEEDARDQTFRYAGGVADFVGYLNENHHGLHETVVFKGRSGVIEVEVAFQYNDSYTESVNSFVNCIATAEGGQHETGFRTAHTRIMKEYAERLGVTKKKKKLSLTGDDLREGLMAVLSLRMTDAEFEGQTKTKLGNPEARSAVEEVVSRHLSAFLDENPKTAKALLEKAWSAASARKAARKARNAVRTGRSSKTRRTSLDGKLTRCASRKAEDNELFIVEGDSAGGSAKQGRDRIYQAILPLKGKPLNTEKASLAKVLSNKEILSIVQAIGAGIGSEFDVSESNYGRVVILADADDDGAHIRCLLLTFFYRFMRPLVSNGQVYIAQPPLYKIERKVRGRRQIKYGWTDADLRRVLDSWGKRATVQRFKGLGEMDPDQLWETTMNPTTRTMVRVTIDDAADAERQVSVLMGRRPELRKRWIVDNVHFGDARDRQPSKPGETEPDEDGDGEGDKADAARRPAEGATV